MNTNGNLENGDYIQSSDVIGHGEKQTSEFLANYTVAKITCDCDFTLNSEDYNCVEFIDSTSGNTYRKGFCRMYISLWLNFLEKSLDQKTLRKKFRSKKTF